jgi:hypothetical protein
MSTICNNMLHQIGELSQKARNIPVPTAVLRRPFTDPCHENHSVFGNNIVIFPMSVSDIKEGAGMQ